MMIEDFRKNCASSSGEHSQSKKLQKKKIRFKKIVRISFSINLNWFQEMLKILTTDSRCCMAETNTTLQSNYAPIKKIYLND